MPLRMEGRYPVVIARLDGPLDHSSAMEIAVSLHGALADQPVQLVLDLTGVTPTVDDVARPLAALVRGARRWPGTRVAVGGAGPQLREVVAAMAAEGADVYPTPSEARDAGGRLPVPPRAQLQLGPTRDAPAAARDQVAGFCGERRLGRWSQLTELLASELVTNAVVHAGTSLTLSVRSPERALQVAVQDGDPRLVAHPMVGPHRLPVSEQGRGLLLLATLADDWGCVPTRDGKVTWASVSLTREPAEQPVPR